MATLGLGVLVLAPAAAAAEGHGFAGEPLTPGTNVQETTLVGSGLYTVPVAQGAEEQYVEVQRDDPDGTLWYGATALVPGSTRTTSPTLTLESSPDGTGDSCVGYESLSSTAGQSGIASELFSTDHSAACRQADSVVLRTAGTDVPPGDFQLLVWEEPAVTNEAMLPEKSLSVVWSPTAADPDPQEVVAGRTFTDAPEVSGGTYAVHVDPGEPALLRVPLTWGQHAQVEATSTTRARGYASVEARWFTPLGGTLGATAYSGGPEARDITLDGSGDPAGWVTPTVAWRNREGPAKQAPAAFAGDYYLSIDTAPEDVPSDGVDVTLTVATVTDYAPKPPEYAQDPPPMPFVNGSSPGERATSSSAADSGTPPWPLVGGLFATAAAFAAAGAVLFLRRRANP
ncbi:hypothetical protein ACT8ZV_15670 [Nocardioides sp. MAHUQ-72]|uniref:hypothetical protein n=1 Tax=unclassified Nocardioides TaxID=2615069 RepID=UPI003621C0FD